MTDAQTKILDDLKRAAQTRHGVPVRLSVNEREIKVERAEPLAPQQEELLEEYIWNSAGNLLIRICYVVWEHIVGEDHEWGRFPTERQAQQRIAALFSSGSLGKGEYYVARLYTTTPPE